MDIQYDNLSALHLLWAVVLLAGIFIYGFRRRRRALETFASTPLLPRLAAGVRRGARRLKALLVLSACIAVVAALTGPRWGVHYEEVQRRGIDVMFCLDVSRSMLAEDVTPNRLERAKQFISDVVARMGGDRAGLVVFAGTPVLQCPLTVDYGTFRMVLQDVGIRSSARGGTLIGDALRLAAGSFTDSIKKHKAVLLITDGEDQSSYPLEAAATAFSEKGIRVYPIGIGDLDEGGRIPVVQDGQRVYLQYNGQEVWSRLDTAALTQMAEVGGGEFIPAGTSQIDMGQFYDQVIATADAREFDAQRVKRYDVQYQWFAGAALLLLLIEGFIRENRQLDLGGDRQLEQAA